MHTASSLCSTTTIGPSRKSFTDTFGPVSPIFPGGGSHAHPPPPPGADAQAVIFVGPITACGAFYGLQQIPYQRQLLDTKLVLIAQWNLGWLFAAIYVLYLTRIYLAINANACRAPARLDRPDQHIYKIMAPSGSLKDAPFVLMAGSGPEGRFNRAQRACFNMDESLPIFITCLGASGLVFGPVVLLVAVISAFGRITFATHYTHHPSKRGFGFFPAVIAEHIAAGLVGLIAVKALLGVEIPFCS